MKSKSSLIVLVLAFVAGSLFAAEGKRPAADSSKNGAGRTVNSALPTFHIVGDSTVHSGGTGAGLWGWGERIAPFFDPTKINVINHAIGGRSARTFYTEGRWQKVLDLLKPGDFVIVQFGHNDQGRIGDPAAKGRPDGKGIGPETVEDTKPDGTKELVHTFGWYMAKYVTDAKAKARPRSSARRFRTSSAGKRGAISPASPSGTSKLPTPTEGCSSISRWSSPTRTRRPAGTKSKRSSPTKARTPAIWGHSLTPPASLPD